jgi:hypothetical protein
MFRRVYLNRPFVIFKACLNMNPTKLLCAATLGVLCGCLAPGATHPLHPPNPNNVTIESTAFIKIGTPQNEIVENLGPPTLQLDHGRLMAYAWRIERGGLHVEIPMPNSSIPIPVKDSHLAYRVYAIQMNSSKQVTRTEFLTVPEPDHGGQSLEQMLDDWAKLRK